MPQNGEINQEFGIYKSLCCGEQIIVPDGNEFPDCAQHPRLPTIWKPLVTDEIIRLNKKRPKDEPAA